MPGLAGWFHAHQQQVVIGGGIGAVGLGVLAAKKRAAGASSGTPTADTSATDLIGYVQPQLDALADASRQQGNILQQLLGQLHKPPATGGTRLIGPPVKAPPPTRTFTPAQVAAIRYASGLASGAGHPVAPALSASRSARPTPPPKPSPLSSAQLAAIRWTSGVVRNQQQPARHSVSLVSSRPTKPPATIGAQGVGLSGGRRLF